MTPVDARLAAALTIQLERWRATLGSGAARVGWKLGVGDRERIGEGPVVGHLTSATQLQPGSVYRTGGAVTLSADAEVGIELGRDLEPGADRDAAQAAISGYGAALELVDLSEPPSDPEDIVAENVFHRAFAFGRLDRPRPREGVAGRLIVNGEVRASTAASSDYAALILSVAGLLEAVGERLQAGDRLITGSIVQVPIAVGDEVIAELGALGRVGLTIAP
jgi:2-keto-4-pentenoate hydratase